MRRPRLVATGFSGFPGAPRNPTQALIEALDVAGLARRLDVELAVTVFPTEYEAARKRVSALWHELTPDAVLHFGLHGRAGRVHVETRARNHMTPVRPDAAGQRPLHPAIERHGPPFRRATVPAPQMAAALRRRGVAVALSADAGAYLCNYVSYLSLGTAPKEALAGFIHLPWPAEIRASGAARNRPGWRALEVAMSEALAVAALAVRSRARPASVEPVVHS